MPGAKTRGNYPSGGWCKNRSKCSNFERGCCDCFKYSNFRPKQKEK